MSASPTIAASSQLVDLELRRRPSQARALATFELVLSTTASLLETHGFDALTTNLISTESGVSVRAIYRYFPNKHAIVTELARQMSGQWRMALEAAGDLGDMSSAWDGVWCSYIDAFVDAVQATPGARAILRAMRSVPELRRVDQQANDEYIAGVADALRTRRPALAAPDAVAVATVLIQSTVAVLDEAFESSDDHASRLVATLKTMHLGLLAETLDE